MLPLGGTLGPARKGLWFGFTMTNAHFTLAFKAALACAISLTRLVWGWPRRRCAGKTSCAAGLYLWCVAGVAGLGPQ
ncbi:hypothetical protein CCO03_09015 [Comamonas serinivorans]|uniref:Uncharacterized protein n=1 Tax=Comamonas serinivorans TaxID=1082851 RepID=A0A1Y0EMY5_9BURK|nr:hypothetical protein CCO03_09015 [Comamonas serinivorans]